MQQHSCSRGAVMWAAQLTHHSHAAPAAPTCRLCERQTKSGGLNGRPEKLQDVCYSWWCLSALSILGRLHWIDQQALTDFILDCQVSNWEEGRRMLPLGRDAGMASKQGCCSCIAAASAEPCRAPSSPPTRPPTANPLIAG